MKIKMLFLTLALAGFWTSLAYADDMKEAAVCRDGKTAYSVNPAEHRGLCSGHGGVDHYADGSAPKSHARKTEYK